MAEAKSTTAAKESVSAAKEEVQVEEGGGAMRRKLVARRLVESHQALGWQLVKGKSPDGLAWQGDAVFMEIPDSQYQKIRKDQRLPFDTVRTRRERGELPVSPALEDGIRLNSSAETSKRTQVGADGSLK